jgi:enhancing lycopene biosynthesis protein 2
MAKKIGVILSGCGVYDGAEIHESVLTLLALDRRGAEAVLCAPDAPQMHVVNHLSGQVEEGTSRNVLVESARIARGGIRDVATVEAAELDGVILPGGFGAAKNLCDFAVKGAECSVHPEVARLVREVHAQGKPVGAVCIAPALVARVLGSEKPKLTIGTDEATARGLEAMGAAHVACAVSDLVVDRERKLVSTPAYMLGKRISDVADGIDKAVGALLELAQEG